LFPLPVESILYHPDFIAMPAAGAGILFRLVLHFWQTECRPLPAADHELRSIARAHAPTWRHWRAQVLSVFDAVRPALEGYYELRLNKKTTLSRLAHRRHSQQRLKASQDSVAGLASISHHVMGPIPKREPARSVRPLLPKDRLGPEATGRDVDHYIR
jgi:uncharacterized protein YdaU (DUF1376 family)